MATFEETIYQNSVQTNENNSWIKKSVELRSLEMEYSALCLKLIEYPIKKLLSGNHT